MIVEARQAFYSEETGAVSPWRDIEVNDTVGEGLIGTGLAVEVSGGSSDLSIATVTLINASEDSTMQGTCALAMDEESGAYSFGEFNVDYVDEEEHSKTLKVILHKGSAILRLWEYAITSVTGDIEVEAGDTAIIHGDGTITAEYSD